MNLVGRFDLRQKIRPVSRITHSKRWRFGAWTTSVSALRRYCCKVSANTKLRDRFCARRCGPSYRRARNASAVLKNFGRHPKKTFATISANSCRSRTSGANLKAFLVRDSQLSEASLSFRGHRNSRQRASTTTVRTTRSQNVVARHGKSWPVVAGEGFAPDLGVVL
jgi:hypothetical protein